MSYRTHYLICYDICEPVRLNRVHHYLIGYKVGGQKSFFECWLTPPELNEVRNNLIKMIDNFTDRIHIFQLDPRMKNECFGKANIQAMNTPFMIL
jgi:CRISPR-associated protein Cas2